MHRSGTSPAPEAQGQHIDHGGGTGPLGPGLAPLTTSEDSLTSRYDERLQQDLDDIRSRLKEVGDQVRHNLRHAVQALVLVDRRLANETIIKDRAVNEDLKELDHVCHLFVVRHLPSAGHLRFVSAVLRLSVALERTGDYATTISRQALALSEKPPGAVRRDVEMMGEQAVKAVAVSMEAFLEGDVEKANLGLGIASQVAASYKHAFRDLIAAAESDRRPVRDAFALLLVLRLLNRAADQADNACELTIFAVTGERKEAKRYRILFVDEDNGMMSKLAEIAAFASYPEAGRFTSAGFKPAKGFAPALTQFCEDRGIDLESDGKPASLEDALDTSRHYHVVVGVGVDPAERMGDIPFRTVILEWDLEEDGITSTSPAEDAYRALVYRVRDLMNTLGIRDHE